MPSKLSNVRGFAERIRLHKFRDCVAFYVVANDGGGREPVQNETVYLSPAMVAELVRLLGPAGFYGSPSIDAEGKVTE